MLKRLVILHSHSFRRLLDYHLLRWIGRRQCCRRCGAQHTNLAVGAADHQRKCPCGEMRAIVSNGQWADDHLLRYASHSFFFFFYYPALLNLIDRGDIYYSHFLRTLSVTGVTGINESLNDVAILDTRTTPFQWASSFSPTSNTSSLAANTTSPPSNTSDPSIGSIGVIVGITIGVLILIAILLFLFIRKPWRGRSSKLPQEQDTPLRNSPTTESLLEPNLKNPKTDQCNRKPDQYNRKPDQDNPKRGRYNQKPDQYNRKPDQYNQKPDQYNRKPDVDDVIL
ncbi:hypothetical protein BC936DRAFT_150121 [Jimgerdemannia flammicorona]|uniref:Mid2 domain-containing protein n=1 Tax=Jimgerdemannia flammicorona TaxID=994334 RepID=A0A433CZG7_9FUNG|nr:hypothetical protein BC936DRAFT_150121 [Jimgerdemannia flammicorona]